MERKEFIESKKYYLKVLAKQITELKAEFKELERLQGNFYDWNKSYNKRCEVIKSKYEYRHNHIAYSLTRGRTYKQVEKIVREGNEPNQDYIEQLLAEYPVVSKVDDEEIVCANS